MHFHLFRYMEYVVIKANRQQLNSKVKFKGRVKVKGQGQGQRMSWSRSKQIQSLTLTLACVLEKSWTSDLEMNLVMDRKFDLEMNLALG